jgi:cyanophycin synthetase
MSQPNLNASARIMYEAAQKMGITCTVFNDKQTILMSKSGISWYTRGSRTSLQSSVGKTIADNKSLTKAVLEHFKLPTAKATLVKKSDEIQQLNNLFFPVVMKPEEGAHGKNVVVGIKDLDEAKKLFEAAQQPMLFEEQLEGIEYRIVCVDYVFIAAAFRKPAHVVGDGQKTISELIAEKNQHPWRGEGHSNYLSLIKIDDLVKEYLAEQHLNLDSVPTKNQEVMLRKTANLSTGGEAWDVTQNVCSENKVLFEQIAQACDLNVIGIDIMCQNLETPIINQPKAGVIEVNASPGLRMHHYPITGQPQDIASLILKMVLKKNSLL